MHNNKKSIEIVYHSTFTTFTLYRKINSIISILEIAIPDLKKNSINPY